MTCAALWGLRLSPKCTVGGFCAEEERDLMHVSEALWLCVAAAVGARKLGGSG